MMNKKIALLFLMVCFVGTSIRAQHTGPSDKSVFHKKKRRIMAGIGGIGDDGGLALHAAYEVFDLHKKVSFLADLNNAGIGIASNNMFDISVYQRNGSEFNTSNGGPSTGDRSVETVTYSKHYLSAYLFKEFDTRFITFGLHAGPAVNYNVGTYEYKPYESTATTADVSFFTVGLHTGQYIHKYLGHNSRGERTFFIRLGLIQLIMAKGSLVQGANLTLGF